MRVPLNRTIWTGPEKDEYEHKVTFYSYDREGLEQAVQDRGIADVMLILNNGLSFIAGCDKRMEVFQGSDWKSKQKGPGWGEGLRDDIDQAILRARKEGA